MAEATQFADTPAAVRCSTSPSSWMATALVGGGRGLPRVEGHRRGVEALRKTVRAAGEMGIRVLTIFSFSSENWARPASEVRDLDGPVAAVHPQGSR